MVDSVKAYYQEYLGVRADILAAERFRELGEVAATVAHNFNNLLMIVYGNASLMLED